MRYESFTGCVSKLFPYVKEEKCEKKSLNDNVQIQLCSCKGDRCNEPETIRAQLFPAKSSAGQANINIGMAVLSGFFVNIML